VAGCHGRLGNSAARIRRGNTREFNSGIVAAEPFRRLRVCPRAHARLSLDEEGDQGRWPLRRMRPPGPIDVTKVVRR